MASSKARRPSARQRFTFVIDQEVMAAISL